MSTIITFFVAPDNETAAGVAEGGPGPDLQVAEYGNFDVWEAIEEWESILLHRDLDEVIADGGADVVSDDGAPLVLCIPPALTTALAGADDEVLSTAATRWVALGADLDEELAREMLGELAALSAAAEQTKGGVYVWVC
ncbi:hypothetical protein AB0J82_16810 [Asanoa sp. NPDC049518]|uniref:hypothetical protein n=1 Tax=unclassified Asanoa TaxID=2685164 RepID=UPI00344A71B1